MVNKTQKYTQEFKNSTIQLALNSEKSAYQIAQDLGKHCMLGYKTIGKSIT